MEDTGQNAQDSGSDTAQHPTEDVPFDPVPKTTIRWDDGLRTDAERCAKDRGVPVAEFVRQSVAHYVAWCEATKAPEPTKPPA